MIPHMIKVKKKKMKIYIYMEVRIADYGKVGDILIESNVNEDLSIYDNCALLSAIKRSVENVAPCYALLPEYTPEHVAQLNKDFKFNPPLVVQKKNFAAIYSTCGDIQMQSHRISRQPMYWEQNNEVFAALESENLHLYFIISDTDDFTRPFINLDDEPVNIYSRNLKGVMINADTGALTILTQEQVDRIFHYNILLFTIQKGQSMHLISLVKKGVNYMNSAWKPCTTRYRNVPRKEPTIEDSVYAIKNAGAEPAPRQIWEFSKDYEKDVLRTAKHMQLLIEFNGKRNPKDILHDAILNLRKQLILFKESYLKGGYENNEEYIKIKKLTDEEEQIYIKSTEKEYDSSYLADHTLFNVLTSHMIRLLLSRYQKFPESIFKALLTHTVIAGRKPHPLNSETVIKYQLPFSINEFKEIYPEDPEQVRRKIVAEAIDNINTALDYFDK